MSISFCANPSTRKNGLASGWTSLATQIPKATSTGEKNGPLSFHAPTAIGSSRLSNPIFPIAASSNCNWPPISLSPPVRGTLRPWGS